MSLQSKIVSINEIKGIVEQLKREGKKIGFTNGCFDILHAGHVLYLERSKSLVDILVLGLNSDNSIKRIKGARRPINGERDRAIVVAGLESVDWVVIFDDDTPIKLIELVKPDVLIKGADWKDKGIVGGDFVKSYGGRVEFVGLYEGRSTTSVIEKIRRVYCE